MEASELDSEYVLSGANEREQEIQIKVFVTTARELYQQDGIASLSDADISKYLHSKKGHRGKALEALGETLVY